jgi:hypothetical protein
LREKEEKTILRERERRGKNILTGVYRERKEVTLTLLHVLICPPLMHYGRVSRD